jgi:hypothetical protein
LERHPVAVALEATAESTRSTTNAGYTDAPSDDIFRQMALKARDYFA